MLAHRLAQETRCTQALNSAVIGLRRDDEHGNGDQRMHPVGRAVGRLDAENGADTGHADEEHDEPCRAIAAVGEGS